MLWLIGKPSDGLVRYLATNTIPYGIIWDSDAPVRTYDAPVVVIDFDNPATLAAQLEPVRMAGASALHVEYERYIRQAANIAAILNLPYLTADAARLATDKQLMRRRLAEKAPQLSPGFAVIKTWDDIITFVDTYGFPVILKPANLMKSLLITKNNDVHELQANFNEAQKQITSIYRRHGMRQTPTLLIEEFLQGSMHTVAGFADASGTARLVPHIVDCLPAQALGKPDSHLFSRQLPSSLQQADQAALFEATRQAVQALGYTSCPIHAEFMMTTGGPKLIEVGSRIGGYRPWMYMRAYSINMYEAAINNSQGGLVVYADSPGQPCAVIELFPDIEGNFVKLPALARIQALPSLHDIRAKVVSGDKTGRASRGFKAAFIIELLHDDAAQLQADIDFIRDNASFELA